MQQQLTFQSYTNNAGDVATLQIKGRKRGISLKLSGGSIDVHLNSATKNVLEELINDAFSCPHFMLMVLEQYPDTYREAREHFRQRNSVY